ncbi:Holliday junction resolvase RecU [uncultured Marinococcus sp.]|uniref:Holliday junction resolvase RecU n=1 Tax=uncultured Marinococcus sp. TaxID=487012 RepID=UPI002622C0D6|nr:Holliday junction resolvase RecU [uncultured Marinococcus sp.]
MAYRYPNGKVYRPKKNASSRQGPPAEKSFANRGMTLEEDINESNEYYIARDIGIIHKKPTPVQIVDVHYPKRSAARITEAYFKQASTTDYNGVFAGRYIDFEAKETRNKTAFPLQNFHDHQADHMHKVQKQDGIAFVLLRFAAHGETYLYDASRFLHWYYGQTKRKSIPYQEIQTHGHSIPLGLHPRLDYLKTVKDVYFH